VPSDFERLLRDVPATFPRPDDTARQAARHRVFGRGPLRFARPRRLSLLTAAAVCVAATIGFTAGHWLVPATGSAAIEVSIATTADTVGFGSPVTLYGSLTSGRAGEEVLIEARDCGTHGSFHRVGGATTVVGGAFAGGPNMPVRVTSQYRARWKDGTSVPVTVRVRPRIDVQYAGGILSVQVFSGLSLKNVRARLQVFDASGSPVTLRTFRVRRSEWTSFASARIHIAIPHGKIARVVLPSTGPCFADATSALVRT
jgi:hypothetical protein